MKDEEVVRMEGSNPSAPALFNEKGCGVIKLMLLGSLVILWDVILLIKFHRSCIRSERE